MRRLAIILMCTLSAVMIWVSAPPLHSTKTKMDFWSIRRQGCNMMNVTINQKDIQAAGDYGIAFVRLAPDKFHSAQRDFLIGDADHYQGLVAEDLAQLVKVLDMYYQASMPVVLTMLSLPGSRWRQNNHNHDDLRLWQDPRYREQAAQF